jgi:hypothetical protein
MKKCVWAWNWNNSLAMQLPFQQHGHIRITVGEKKWRLTLDKFSWHMAWFVKQLSISSREVIRTDVLNPKPQLRRLSVDLGKSERHHKHDNAHHDVDWKEIHWQVRSCPKSFVAELEPNPCWTSTKYLHIIYVYIKKEIYTGRPPSESKNQQLPDQLVDWFDGWLIIWLTAWLVDWWPGCLVDLLLVDLPSVRTLRELTSTSLCKWAVCLSFLIYERDLF